MKRSIGPAIAGALLVVCTTNATNGAPPAIQSAEERVDRTGQVISRWSPGSLDIHQISTGRGNAALVVMPDGTTLLVDAGAATAPLSDARPNGARSAGGWIAHYIDHVLPGSAPRRLDYALITHFHADHMSGLSDVAGLLPIQRIIDRGWPDYAFPAPITDATVRDYRRFLEQRIADRSLIVERIRVGRADQLVPRIDPRGYPAFEIRGVAANGEIWTGRGAATMMRFPKSASPDPDISWENISSIGIRIRYGRFDFFTGGDAYGMADPGLPAWMDVETPIARAIGPTDVHVVNMHGSITVENPFFLTTLRSRVIIVPSWSATHPSADVLKRVMAPRAYPGPRDVFATVLHEPTRAAMGARANQIKGIGHIAVRVAPGGATYRVVVVDDSTDALTVKSVHGPYQSE